MRSTALLLSGILLGCAAVLPQEARAAGKKARIEDPPILVTPFFYWYCRKTGEHFINADGTDALTDHPLNPEGYCYRNPQWWKRELLAVRKAGIDAILPVYWGVPGVEKGWSKEGLRALVPAWDELSRQGMNPPKVAMFYDTSTLRYNPFRKQIAVDRSEGVDFFCNTILEFFELVPARMRLRREGRPVVFLYSAAFCRGENPSLFPQLRRRFRRRFGTDLFLVKEISWPYQADAVYAWGGALGFKLYSVASLGPGYDHSAVPGRRPLIVDRKGGDFYRKNWLLLLALPPQTRPRIAVIETWNEFHEGTDIAPSKEYGWQYVRMTAHYSKLFKKQAQIAVSGPYAGKSAVSWRPGKAAGLKPKKVEDGLFAETAIAGRSCIETRPNRFGSARYLYFDAAESFAYKPEGIGCRVNLTIYLRNGGPVVLEYDSADQKSSVRSGAFKRAVGNPSSVSAGKWCRVSFELPDARFTNRTNGADFRLSAGVSTVAVSEAEVKLLRRGRRSRP